VLGEADGGDCDGEEQPEGKAEETKRTHWDQDSGALEEKRNKKVTFSSLC